MGNSVSENKNMFMQLHLRCLHLKKPSIPCSQDFLHMFHRDLLLQQSQKKLSGHGNKWFQICPYSAFEPEIDDHKVIRPIKRKFVLKKNSCWE